MLSGPCSRLNGSLALALPEEKLFLCLTKAVSLFVRGLNIVCPPGLLWEEDVEAFERVNRINYLGVFYTLKAALPDMVERGVGRVLLVSSLVANLGKNKS